MNLRITSPILAMAVLLLSGCILLPVPHEQWLSPRFTGSVADAESGAPLRGVKITLTGYRYAEEEVGAVVAYTDETGRFSVLASKHTNWMPIWLGPAEGVQGGTVVFECNGYVAATEKRSVFTVASGRTAFELAVRMKKKQPNRVAGSD